MDGACEYELTREEAAALESDGRRHGQCHHRSRSHQTGVGNGAAQINIVPQSRFLNQWNTVTKVNATAGRIDIAESERHRLIDSGSWFWMPPADVAPNTLTFIAPQLPGSSVSEVM